MKNPITFYQASNLSDTEIKEQFTVRKKEFEKVIFEIRLDKMEGSIQHYIFIGQRGSGKSTLLRRIQAEINTDIQLNDKLVAVNLSEEQAGIYRLHDLWERVNQELSIRGFEVEEPDWEDFCDQPMEYTKALYFNMQKALNREGKKLILLLDNIDRILENIKKDENHLLREVMLNHKDFRIIGGSTRLSEHHWKYDEPFYEFFNIIRLSALTQNEVKELLLFWSDFLEEPSLRKFTEKNPGKLNAVRILSDGMPRTMLNFVELLIKQPNQYGYEYLRMIVDRATPIYQERLSTLSPLQQKVILEISFFWDAVKVKEISKSAKIESKTLSAILGQLTELQIVEKIKGEGKNLAYRIKERFFNLWLIMTQGGPKQKRQAKYLTIFLETWYDPHELRKMYEIYSDDLRVNMVAPDRAVLMTPALAHSRYISAYERDELIERTKSIIENKKNYLELLPQKTSDIYKHVNELIEKGSYTKAIKELKTIDQDDAEKSFLLGVVYQKTGDTNSAEKFWKQAIEMGQPGAMFNLGLLLDQRGELKLAEKYYMDAVEAGHTGSMNNLGVLFEQYGDLENAEKYYRQAANAGSPKAMFNLGILIESSGDLTSAMEYYKQAAEAGLAEAMLNLGVLFDHRGDLKTAEKYYKQAANSGDLRALVNLGALFEHNRDLKEAEKFYQQAAKAGQTEAFFYLGLLLEQRGDLKSAEEYYKQAAEVGNSGAMFKLGGLSYQNGDLKSAEEYYKLAAEAGQTRAMFNLAFLLYQVNKDQERSLDLIYKVIASDNENDIRPYVLNIIISFWSGKMDELNDSKMVINQLIDIKDIPLLEFLIKELLVHHQKNLVWNWFHDESVGEVLKDLVRPQYFVVAHLLKTKDAEEVLLKQPPELEEPVQSILQSIHERQEFYYPESGKNVSHNEISLEKV